MSSDQTPQLRAVPDQPVAAGGYDRPHDRVNARITQASAIIQYLRADDRCEDGPEMADFVLKNALWAVADLLDDADHALKGEG